MSRGCTARVKVPSSPTTQVPESSVQGWSYVESKGQWVYRNLDSSAANHTEEETAVHPASGHARYPPSKPELLLEEVPGSTGCLPSFRENSSGSACGGGSRSRFLAAFRLHTAQMKRLAAGICPQQPGLGEGKMGQERISVQRLPHLALNYVSSTFCAMWLNVCSWGKKPYRKLKTSEKKKA